MPLVCYNEGVLLSLFHDNPASQSYYAGMEQERLYEKLRTLDDAVQRGGLAALNPVKDPLSTICSLKTSKGRVRKYGLGAFSMSWRIEDHEEWPSRVMREIDEIQARVKEGQGARVRHLIWVGARGWTEDKAAYGSAGLLRRVPRCYVLDSTDPAKMKAILDDIVRRSGLRLPDALRSTLVISMASGRSSDCPELNLERLAALFERHRIDLRPNCICITPAGSSLEAFAKARGFETVRPQMDGADTIAARHSAPLSRGSLYPLGFSKVDLQDWIRGTYLTRQDVHVAWQLSAFLHTQAESGRDKLTLVLPSIWSGVGNWTRHVLEETLGQTDLRGLKVVLENKIRLANYRSPRDPAQDRSFFAVKVKGIPIETPDKVALLRRRGYPIACLTLPKGAVLSSYMQFIHYAAFGLARLRNLNFLAGVGRNPCQTVARNLLEELRSGGGMERSTAWQNLTSNSRKVRHRDSLRLFWSLPDPELDSKVVDAPTLYASIVKQSARNNRIDYAELTFFGDTRYTARGKAVLKVLNRSAERLYRSRLKMAVNVCEGSAMNFSYLATSLRQGRCLSTVLVSEKPEKLASAGHNANHHVAHFLAMQAVLAERKRPVVVLTLKDLEEPSIIALEDFFRQAATALRKL